jgi:hypothetical protein
VNAPIDTDAIRRCALVLACVLLSWTFAVTVLLAILRMLPITAGDAPDHLQ